MLNGYVLHMWQNPAKYEERNNKSYRVEREWANDAVLKLLEANLIREVDKSELWCVNPLTVAKNAKGKRRLCIDLSRCVNTVIKAPKFKIESTISALQVIKEGDFKINDNFLKYFGFCVELEDGSRRFFQYLNMPFRLNDACRVLTKLLRSLLER